MNKKVFGYKLFCWLYIIMGIVHEMIVIPQHLSIPPEPILYVLEKMKEIKIFNSTFYHFFVGYDLLIGCMFIAYGYLCLTLINQLGKKIFELKKLNVVIITINLATSVIAYQFFFILPILFTFLSFTSHVFSIMIKDKK